MIFATTITKVSKHFLTINDMLKRTPPTQETKIKQHLKKKNKKTPRAALRPTQPNKNFAQ